MVVIATEEPPPPPPEPRKKRRKRKPKLDEVKCTGDLPLERMKRFPIPLWPGFTIVISLLWLSKIRWLRCEESKPDSGWFFAEIGFIVVALKVEW